MDFINLDRSFGPLRRDQPVDLDLVRWGRSFGSWVSWPMLLQQDRVVLLAEASSGKTEELRAKAQAIVASGEAGFFVRIEDLSENGLEASLDPGQDARLCQWRATGNSTGWFFLDSVDEARLNRKSFERAMRRFAKELGECMARARVIISCRVSDWKGTEDRNTILRLLPVPPRAPPVSEREPQVDLETLLLDPIFGKEPDRQPPITYSPDLAADSDLFVVQLIPLSYDQRRQLAVAAGISDVEVFLRAIERTGLGAMAERPGDLLDLAGYWRDHNAFGSLAVMSEHAVSRKLREPDRFRPDNGILSTEQARQGAERVAAALTFGRSFTLLSTGDEADPSLASDALDLAHILPEWDDAQRGALLRRGIFAPSTYGRVRFHHRSTQEFLTAAWLSRLLEAGRPMSDIWELIFVERYGVKTIPPSLRPAAAWLALSQPAIRSEIVAREPVALISNGDPRSLPLETRSALLRAYADHHAAGSIANSWIEDRAIRLFAESALAGAIRQAWVRNSSHNFRIDLLRCIREAAICHCSDLAFSAALDETGSDGFRIEAVEALAAACESKLADLTKRVLAAPEGLSPRLAAVFANELFPRALDVRGLLHLIARSQSPRADADDGFGRYFSDIIQRATLEQQRALAFGLADAALAPHLDIGNHALNPRYNEIIKELSRFAIGEVARNGDAIPAPAVVRLLLAIERVDDYPEPDGVQQLRDAVRSRPAVNEAIFWGDIDFERQRGRKLVGPWSVSHGSCQLWTLSPTDLGWLADSVRTRDADDRMLAFKGVIAVLVADHRFESAAAWLNELVAGDPDLENELEQLRTRRDEVREEAASAKLIEKHKVEKAEKEAVAKESWKQFRFQIFTDPALLSSPERLSSWKAGVFRLFHLAVWLRGKRREELCKAVIRWGDLTEPFGLAVAEAFRDGMKLLWRVTKPERPKYSAENRVTAKNSTALAIGGLNIEASSSDSWIDHLTVEDAQRAAGHGALSEQGFPEWMPILMAHRAADVMPVIVRALRYEWNQVWGRGELYEAFARRAADPMPDVLSEVARLFQRQDPGTIERLRRAVEILICADMAPSIERRLTGVGMARFNEHRDAGRSEWARLYLALVMALDPEQGLAVLKAWLASTIQTDDTIQQTFADLFGRERAILSGVVWRKFSLPVIEELLRLAYHYVRRSDDIEIDGPRSIGLRDYAQDGRSAALTALLARSGPEAHAVLLRLAGEPDFASSAHRFRELAHNRVEIDSEAPACFPNEVVRFERAGVAPVKTGADLVRVVYGILRDIQIDFGQADASSRAVLSRATAEGEFQDWLVEQLNLRSKGRFHATRESHVAGEKRPDILVASSSAKVQVAMELKHGGKKWTAVKLRHALKVQLADQYLLPTDRRHGVFVISRAKGRSWRHPEGGTPMSFEKLCDWLAVEAERLSHNRAGPIEVRVFGLDPT